VFAASQSNGPKNTIRLRHHVLYDEKFDRCQSQRDRERTKERIQDGEREFNKKEHEADADQGKTRPE